MAAASPFLNKKGRVGKATTAIGFAAGLASSGLRDYDVVVVDSAPNDVVAIVEIARIAALILVPPAPTPIEVDQLGDTVDLSADTSARWSVAPVRARWSTSAGRSIQQLCIDQGIPVTAAVVPLSEAVARSLGEAPPPLSYSALARELQGALDLEVVKS